MGGRNPGKNASAGRGAVKHPYNKPEFRFERVFETMALACGKIEKMPGQCRFNRKNS